MTLLLRACAAALLILSSASMAAAQTDWTYRGRIRFEAEAAERSTTALLIAASDVSWEPESRVRFGGGLIALAWNRGATLRVREAFARVSPASWMDIEAGKKLVRWGVGYGFSPTGVLDPPRSPLDPTDRLGVREGLRLARVDFFRGGTSATVAVAATGGESSAESSLPVFAARVRTVLPGGLEVAVIGKRDQHRQLSYGANATHVIGQRLEWHSEFLIDGARSNGRHVSAATGFQYTVAGANVVMEYHRHGVGPTGAPDHVLFTRAARAGADLIMEPELIVVRSMTTDTLAVVVGMTWTIAERLAVSGRATRLAGPFVPRRTTVSAGATLRF
jgi:hypothetical protein